MDGAELTYDAEADHWIAPDGRCFIKNVFLEDAPVWIEVGANEWRARYMNCNIRLSWPDGLDAEVAAAVRRIVHTRIKTRAPSALIKYAPLLKAIDALTNSDDIVVDRNVLGDVEGVNGIWAALNASDRVTFRELYRDLAEIGLCGADRYVADRMRGWKARTDVQTLRDVIRWDPERGALSTSELEVLRRVLEDRTQDKTNADHFVRVSLRIFLATLRRPSQILQIGADGLRRVASNRGEQFFLKIPKVKGQAATEAEWEGIPAVLAKDILAYRTRAEIARLCKTSAVLLPHVLKNGEEAALSTASFNGVCKCWFDRRNIISPRTKQPMRFATTRLRHTGATQMAMQGYSRQLVQDVLQHDSPFSANAYIDSVGADTLPLFEKMTDRLGSRFADLKNAWFNGRIIEANRDAGAPIIVPVTSGPAIVGACGKSGPCTLHPLFSCYSCEHFLAFRQANHGKVLDYIEEEYLRWRNAEIGASRSKAMKDFERTAAGVRDVIDRIERESREGAA